MCQGFFVYVKIKLVHENKNIIKEINKKLLAFQYLCLKVYKLSLRNLSVLFQIVASKVLEH